MSQNQDEGDLSTENASAEPGTRFQRDNEEWVYTCDALDFYGGCHLRESGECPECEFLREIKYEPDNSEGQ
jgi:hypothetical protein